MSTIFLDKPQDIIADLQRIADTLTNTEDVYTLRAVAAELKYFKDKYYDLIYQVGNIHDGENRHETAKRYIREAEVISEPCSVAGHKEKLTLAMQKAAGTANALGYDDGYDYYYETWDANK